MSRSELQRRQEEAQLEHERWMLRLQQDRKKQKTSKKEKKFNKRKSFDFFMEDIFFSKNKHRYVRNPEEWVSNSYNIDKQKMSFCRWVFCKYDVPVFLLRELVVRKMDRNFYGQSTLLRRQYESFFVDWFFTIGGGGSFAKKVKGLFTKKEAHLYLNAPSSNDPFENIWWVKIHSKEFPSSITDVFFTKLKYSDPMEDYYDNMLTFFERYKSRLTRDLLEELLDYLTRNKIEFKGRTLASVTQLSNEWHLMVNISKGTKYHSWLPMSGVDKWKAKEKNGPTWVVIELTTSKKLLAEGKSQRHCVGSYANVCGEHGHHIFTMNKHTEFEGREKCVTIEVDSNRRVVQVRGKLNRRANSKEVQVLRLWAAENNIRY